MNVATSKDPASLFPNVLIYTDVEYKDGKGVSRNIIANDQFKKRENGEHIGAVTFKTEQDRVKKLKDLGLELTEEEIEGIKGRGTAIDVYDPLQSKIDIFTAFG